MSTVNERDVLRRALHLADGIQPRADGLQLIQARLSPPRPVAVAWAEAAWTDARMRGPAELRRFLEWLLSVARLAWDRFGPQSVASGGRTSRTLSWLRPAAALGVTVFIVAAGAYVAFSAQQAIFPAGSNSTHPTGGGGGGNTHGGASGTNTRSQSSVGSVGSAGSKTKPGSCVTPKPSRGAPSASTSSGQTPGTSPAASPSGSSSASPTPTVSDSPSPGASTTPTAGVANAAMAPTGAGPTEAVASLAKSAVLTRISVVRPSPTPCATKKPARNQLGATLHPSAHPAVIGFGKLNGS
ncbi:MAG TPA: hypothetical protein VLM11_20240 [Streptosporangiaceae bacterium]|nr:hypothetical protein [Streptosporangiaceae bacterium]